MKNKSKGLVGDNMLSGAVAGFILPLIVFLVVYLISSGNITLNAFLRRIVSGNVITHFISLCVFPNVFIFLISNRFNKLRLSRGILGATIIWALLVFIIKMV